MTVDVASLTLPRRLNDKLKEKAANIGVLPEELGVEFLLKGLNEELDPEELVEHYQLLSEKYLTEARELLKEEDLVQAQPFKKALTENASLKFWGATALAVKRVAAIRGLKLDKHGSLWDFVSKISRESGDEDFIRLFFTANALHRNVYEGQMNKEALEIANRDIEKLIDKLRRIS
ncbi:MAG: PaREP1 family protein [Methanophagales archaeon]|nr:PaREP1 family protein [Methanophagales archaeon]